MQRFHLVGGQVLVLALIILPASWQPFAEAAMRRQEASQAKPQDPAEMDAGDDMGEEPKATVATEQGAETEQ